MNGTRYGAARHERVRARGPDASSLVVVPVGGTKRVLLHRSGCRDMKRA